MVSAKTCEKSIQNVIKWVSQQDGNDVEGGIGKSRLVYHMVAAKDNLHSFASNRIQQQAVTTSSVHKAKQPLIATVLSATAYKNTKDIMLANHADVPARNCLWYQCVSGTTQACPKAHICQMTEAHVCCSTGDQGST